MPMDLFAPSQRPADRAAIRNAPRFHGAASDDMSDAQIGLMTATPIIIVFAIALRRMGVLSTVATVSAVSLSVAIGGAVHDAVEPSILDPGKSHQTDRTRIERRGWASIRSALEGVEFRSRSQWVTRRKFCDDVRFRHNSERYSTGGSRLRILAQPLRSIRAT